MRASPPEVDATTPPARGAVDPGESDLLAKAQGGNLFAFEEIVKRFSGAELTAEPERLRSNFIGGIKRMPVRFA